MKILITYASKHGFAKKCVQTLSERLEGEIDVRNLKEDKNIDLTKYDKVIIGGSIYMGQIQKEVKEFTSKNLETLKRKKIGFFIACMQEGDNARTQINNSFPEELLKSAVATENFGGGFYFKKMNFLERLIIKKIAKTSQDADNSKVENIDNFISLMNKA